MKNREIFKHYHSRLVLEGAIKAVLWGLIAGLGVGVLPAIFILFSNLSGAWVPISIPVTLGLSLGLGFGVAAIAAPIFYFHIFKPTAKQIARRVDRLGFDERLVTMLELENDDSYIAMAQREEAKATLKANKKPLKIAIVLFPVIAVAVLSFAVAGFTTGGILTYESLSPFMDPFSDDARKDTLVSVSYDSLGGGFIVGKAEQIFLWGQDATTVIAEADEGYFFAGWLNALTGELDKVENPERLDKNVRSDIVLVAVFLEMDGESEGNSGESPPGDEPPSPGDSGQGSSEDGPPNSGGGQGNPDKDVVLDGDTHYKIVWTAFLQEALDIMNSGGVVDPYTRAIIEAYFKQLQ